MGMLDALGEFGRKLDEQRRSTNYVRPSGDIVVPREGKTAAGQTADPRTARTQVLPLNPVKRPAALEQHAMPRTPLVQMQPQMPPQDPPDDISRHEEWMPRGTLNTSEPVGESAPTRSKQTPLPTWEDMFTKYLQMAGGGRSFASANLVNQFATGAAASQLNSLAGNAARQRAQEKDVYQEWKDRQAMKSDKSRSDLEAKRLGLETQRAEKELSALGPQGMTPLQQADIDLKRAQIGQMGSKEDLAREKMLMTLRAQLAELPVGTKERELAEQQLSILEQGETPEYFYKKEQSEQNYLRPEWLGGKPDVPYKAEQYGYRPKPKKTADKTALGQPVLGNRG